MTKVCEFFSHAFLYILVNKKAPMEYTLQDYTDCDHFGTVTLKPALYELPIAEQIKKTLVPLFTLLKQFSTNFLLTLELTKTNNLHYHFICKAKDIELDPFMFCDALRTYNWKHKRDIFGFAEYELMHSWDKSALYITKDIKKTSAKIGQRAWYDYKHAFIKTVAKKVTKKVLQYDEQDIVNMISVNAYKAQQDVTAREVDEEKRQREIREHERVIKIWNDKMTQRFNLDK